MCHCCSIIPNDVLLRLAERDVSDETRKSLLDTAALGARMRELREKARELTATSSQVEPPITLAAIPSVTTYDCRHTQSLPGEFAADAASSTDVSVRRCAVETRAVADFFRKVFKRNSIDAHGMTMVSSVHYGSGYNNALWNGQQMIYGDGDGEIFLDFTAATDVIAHELTHGVTQHSLQLVYEDEAGGLNESLSDVFGSMFRQWRADQTVTTADWLIGADILGPSAIDGGYTCLRDMANPSGDHCLGQQISSFEEYHHGMDPHVSSGPPNLAFYTSAMALGGRSWERAGQIWYRAMASAGPRPEMTMAEFADLTRKAAADLFPDAAVQSAVDNGWKRVGL